MQALKIKSETASLWNLNLEQYVVHDLHGPNRKFVESNCYIDIWVEVIHALKLDVYPFLAFTLASDFEDDQWTFYKPSFDDLQFLYGISVQELYLWGELHKQIALQLQNNKMVLLEADSYFLPDTLETDYRKNHVKTTIGIESIDLRNKTLNYFHNAGYYRLGEDDFNCIFRPIAERFKGYLPPYCEIVKFNSLQRYSDQELFERSKVLTKRYVRLLPSDNPITRFKYGFQSLLPELCEQGLESYHHYAFGSLRQLGSCYEFSAYFLRGLAARDAQLKLEDVAKHFDEISLIAKTLILKGARMVNRNTIKDVTADFDAMSEHWDSAMTSMREIFA